MEVSFSAVNQWILNTVICEYFVVSFYLCSGDLRFDLL